MRPCPLHRPRGRPCSTLRCACWRSADPEPCAYATWRRRPSSRRWASTRTSGQKQGLLEQLYLHGFRRLEDRLNSVPSDGQGEQELLALALAYRAFALDNDALYGLMFERATPDFAPSDASRLAGLATFQMLATRVAEWRPDFTDPAADAHLIWATMTAWSPSSSCTGGGGPPRRDLQDDPEQN